MMEDEMSAAFGALFGESCSVTTLTRGELSEIEQAAYDKGRRDAKLDYVDKIDQAYHAGWDDALNSMRRFLEDNR